jgi:hypothetical protein
VSNPTLDTFRKDFRTELLADSALMALLGAQTDAAAQPTRITKKKRSRGEQSCRRASAGRGSQEA